MIDAQVVGEIIAEYQKHGWKLRRALLASDARDKLSELVRDIDVQSSVDINALWFSRRSRSDREAWELRRLTALPFALVAVVPTSATYDELESALAGVEEDMRERTIA